MLMKPEKLPALTRLQETNGGSVNGIIYFDLRCATFTFCIFLPISSLYIVYNAKLAFLTLVFPRSMDVVAWPVQWKFSCCRKVQKSCNEHRDPFQSASLALYTIYNDMMSMKV